jgi:hypothetical protein
MRDSDLQIRPLPMYFSQSSQTAYEFGQNNEFLVFNRLPCCASSTGQHFASLSMPCGHSTRSSPMHHQQTRLRFSQIHIAVRPFRKEILTAKAPLASISTQALKPEQSMARDVVDNITRSSLGRCSRASSLHAPSWKHFQLRCAAKRSALRIGIEALQKGARSSVEGRVELC